MKHRAIGMFDSGFGGLTVMRQFQKILPEESVVYLGDTARLPYGEKSAEIIEQYSIQNGIFLMRQNIKLLIVACNTAASVAIDPLRKIFNIPVLGVIQPGAREAVRQTRTGKIAVLGTKGTIRSGCYQKAIQDLLPHAEVTSIACPLWVPLVEEHFLHHPSAKLIVEEYLKPVKAAGVDTVLLGCTHYPLLHALIEKELGSAITIVEPAEACAKEAADLLATQHLQNPEKDAFYRYFVSDDPDKFRQIGSTFLGAPLPTVETCRYSH